MTRVPIQEVMQIAADQCKRGAFSDAERTYRHILAQAPNHAAALNGLAMLLARFGENGEAIELLGKAIASEPKEAQYHDSLGTLLKTEGKIGEAIACFERAVEIRPEFDAARFH